MYFLSVRTGIMEDGFEVAKRNVDFFGKGGKLLSFVEDAIALCSGLK